MKNLKADIQYKWLWKLLFILTILLSISAYGVLLTKDGPASIDVPVLLWFRTHSNPAYLSGPDWMTNFWLFLTWLGDTAPRIIVALCTAITLLLMHRWRNALFIVGVLVSGITLSTILKSWIGRPRPQLVPHLDQVSSMSFPSGHTFNSTLFYLVIVLVIAPLIKRQSIRNSLYFLAISLSIATGVSRIALGVHWPSDVIAGWLIAVAWAFLWLELARHYWPEALH